ncbi:MAG: hypothetical protein AAF961_19265, partial [Planctomycetota bacterium]
MALPAPLLLRDSDLRDGPLIATHSLALDNAMGNAGSASRFSRRSWNRDVRRPRVGEEVERPPHSARQG